MNPFLKNASGMSGQQLADRLINRIEKARTEQPDPNEALFQAQEQQAEQAKEQQAMQEKQVKEQERTQRQNEMQERQENLKTQQRSEALSRASTTPSFKPYVIKKQAGMRIPEWAKSLWRNTGSAAKHPVSVGGGTAAGWDWLAYGRENGYAPDTWTSNRISGAVLNTALAGSARQMQRGWNQKATALAKKLDPVGAQNVLQAADVKGKLLLTGGTTLFPIVERPLAAGAVSIPKILDEKQKQSVLDTKLKEKALKATDTGKGTNVTVNQSEGSDAWKWLAGAGLGLAAIPAAAYAYKTFRKEPEEEEKAKKNPDRVALEIPSHKISDKLYNRLGREILFEDKEEAERRAKTAHAKMASTKQSFLFGSKSKPELSFEEIYGHPAFKVYERHGLYADNAGDEEALRDAKAWLMTMSLPEWYAAAENSPDLRNHFLIDPRLAVWRETFLDNEGNLKNDSTDPFQDYKDINWKDSNIFSFDKVASVKETGSVLTPDQARQTVSSRGLNKYFKDRHTPSGMWSTIETYAPMVSGLLGGPQLSTFNQRMAQHLVPLQQGQEAPWVKRRWAETFQPRPRVKWTPGRELNITPDYNV